MDYSTISCTKSDEKPITILPYARIGRHVWFNVYLLINRMGILRVSKAHPGKGAFFVSSVFLRIFDSNYNVATV